MTISHNHIDDQIESEDYHTFPGKPLVICALTLKNGFFVCGEGSAASAEEFNEDTCKATAKTGARNKIWAFENYLKKSLAL